MRQENQESSLTPLRVFLPFSVIRYILFLMAFGVTHSTRPLAASSLKERLMWERWMPDALEMPLGVLGPLASASRHNLLTRPWANETSSHTTLLMPIWI